jgi:hypothetical protein
LNVASRQSDKMNSTHVKRFLSCEAATQWESPEPLHGVSYWLPEVATYSEPRSQSDTRDSPICSTWNEPVRFH